MHPRARTLIDALQLAAHPEGGHYREVFRSPARVQPADARPVRAALTTIDFLLAAGEFSAWHRVASDEVWHLIEGGPLELRLVAPDLSRAEAVVMEVGGVMRRHVVPAGWWQAAIPLGDYAWCGATVGPGFDFADFAFGRDEPEFKQALARLDPTASRWL